MSAEYLILLDGAPAPDLADVCLSVQVEQSLSEPTRYAVKFLVELDQVGQYTSLTDLRLRPGAMLTILVADGLTTECLVRGPIDRHQVHIETGGAGSWLEVSGGDRRVEMGRAHRTVAWTGRDSDIATTIIAGYTMRPDIGQTTHLHTPISHTQNQCGSDLEFLNRLARRNGFQFWISYDVAGLVATEVGHFKPSPPRLDILASSPVVDPFRPSLQINVGDRTSQTHNSIDIDADFDRPTLSNGLRVLEGVNSITPAAVPAPPNLPLGLRPLLSFASGVPRELSLATAGDSTELTTRARAALAEAEWFVQARVRTTKFALGDRILQPHMVIPVNGLGQRYSGEYFVTAVTHTLDGEGHAMDLTLARNALGA